MTLRSRIMTKRRWGLSPWLERSSGEGDSSPHLSCLGDPTCREAWLAAVHWVAEDADTALRPNDNMTNSLIQSFESYRNKITGNGHIQANNMLAFLKTSIPLLKIICFPVTLVSCLWSLHTLFYIKIIIT